jgi:hypothetical protein
VSSTPVISRVSFSRLDVEQEGCFDLCRESENLSKGTILAHSNELSFLKLIVKKKIEHCAINDQHISFEFYVA